MVMSFDRMFSRTRPGDNITMGCWLRKTTVQSVNHATLTAVAFSDADTFDNVPSGVTQLHDPSTNNSRITLPQRGFWMVFGQLAYAGGTGTAWDAYCYLTKNGSTVIAPWVTTATASIPYAVNAVGLVYAASGDYLEMKAYHGQGSAMNVGDYGSGTFFGAVYLGDYQ